MKDTSISRNKSPSLIKLELTNVKENKTYDLRYVYTELNIYSSIDGIITSGDVTISEQGNLISLAPLDGREFIEIKFCSLDKSYEEYHRIFFVYAVDNLIEVNDSRVYTIRFTDVFGKINPDIRMSITYDSNVEEIIGEVEKIVENPEMGFEEYKQIMNNHSSVPTGNRLFPFKTDDALSVTTEYKIRFTVPEWHPLRLISYLTERGISSENASLLEENKFSDCVFFQNRKGEFIFTSYKKMFETQLSNEYTQNIVFRKVVPNAQENADKKVSGIPEEKYSVFNYSLNKVFNDQYQKQLGFFGFTIFITDFAKAKNEPFTVTNDEIQSCILRYGIFSEKEQYPYETIKKTENGVYYYGSTGTNTTISYDEYNKVTLPYIKGMAIKKYLEYAKITLEMNGVSDIDIGNFVYIDLGNYEDNNSIATYVKGVKWVISKYSHRFLADGTYTTLVECFTPYINREKKTN